MKILVTGGAGFIGRWIVKNCWMRATKYAFWMTFPMEGWKTFRSFKKI